MVNFFTQEHKKIIRRQSHAATTLVILSLISPAIQASLLNDLLEKAKAAIESTTQPKESESKNYIPLLEDAAKLTDIPGATKARVRTENERTSYKPNYDAYINYERARPTVARFVDFRSKLPVGAVIEEIKKATGDLVEENGKTYYFEMEGDTIKSLQADTANIEFTRNLLRYKTGIIEPVMNLDLPSFRLSIDRRATEEIHTNLSKTLKIAPLETSLKFGEILEEIWHKELEIKQKIVQELLEKNKDNAIPRFSVMDLLGASNLAKTIATEETEGVTFYNKRFKEKLDQGALTGVDYIISTNKSDVSVDAAAANYASKLSMEKGLALQIRNASSLTQRMSVLKTYWEYLAFVQSMAEAQMNGYFYVNTSLQIFSIDRLRNLIETGSSTNPELKVIATSLKLLNQDNSLVNYVIEYYGDSGRPSASIRECYPNKIFPTIDDEKCWKPMIKNYRMAWELINADVGGLNSYRSLASSIRSQQFREASVHFDKAMQKLGLSGRIDSIQLK